MAAITADTKAVQAQLNLVWDKLLPAFHEAPLRANSGDEARLKQALANLAVRSSHVPTRTTLPSFPKTSQSPASRGRRELRSCSALLVGSVYLTGRVLCLRTDRKADHMRGHLAEILRLDFV